MLAEFKRLFDYLLFKWWLPYRRAVSLRRLGIEPAPRR
jgi:hypothetical protein